MELQQLIEIVKSTRELFGKVINWARRSVWRRLVVYIIAAITPAAILYMMIYSLNYFSDISEKEHSVISSLLVEKNRLIIARDIVGVCINSKDVVNIDWYCDEAIEFYKNRTESSDEHIAKIVSKKAFERMYVELQGDIASIEFKQMVQLHERNFYGKILDVLMTPVGITFLIFIAFIIYFITLAAFAIPSRWTLIKQISEITSRYASRRQ